MSEHDPSQIPLSGLEIESGRKIADKLAPKKPSKKHKRKSRSLRDMQFETLTPAQTVMRDEMARGVHQPAKLVDILREQLGDVPSDGIVATEALAIINQHGDGLRTGLTEWSIIQRLVEQAYIQGFRDGSARVG